MRAHALPRTRARARPCAIDGDERVAESAAVGGAVRAPMLLKLKRERVCCMRCSNTHSSGGAAQQKGYVQCSPAVFVPEITAEGCTCSCRHCNGSSIKQYIFDE